MAAQQGGVIYNKRIWKEAGIDKLPATPDEFLECLQKIKDNTDAIPLYTNFAAGWELGISISESQLPGIPISC
jgi:ABC-type glycerol-3-phosphate transport system substrate-binding protein